MALDFKTGTFMSAAGQEPLTLAAPQAPVVSVIVTNHNYAHYLENCLASIAGQSYPNIECIVVDDASTDGSAELLDTIAAGSEFSSAGRRLQVMKNDVSLGQIASSIAGFSQSSGKYIIFFDSDDYMLPHCIEAHVTAYLYSRYAVGISSVDVFYEIDQQVVTAGHGGFAHYVTSGAGQREAFGRKISLPFACARADFAPPLNLDVADIHHVPPNKSGWFWGNTSALCFRREMVAPMFARTPNFRQALDNYLLYSIHPITGSILIDRPLVVYRAHANNSWIVFPRVENLLNSRRERHFGRDREIVNEILTSYLFSAAFFAEFLADDDVFMHAINSLCVLPWCSKFGRNKPFSQLAFLRENEGRLRAVFGDETYQRWMRPFSLAGRIKIALQKAGILQIVRRVLRRAIGESGIARLRVLLQR